MCGIAGLVSNQPLRLDHYALFIEGLQAQSGRGDRGVGYFKSGNIYAWKTSFDDTDLEIRRKLFSGGREDSTYILGHVRAPTGRDTSQEVQPRSIGPVTIGHNGILLDWQKQIPQHFTIKKHLLRIDSDLIAARIAHHCGFGFNPIEAIQYALEGLDGSYACWVYIEDDRLPPYARIFFFRNISALYSVRVSIGEQYAYMFASEPWLETFGTWTFLEEGAIYNWRFKKIGSFESYSPYKI